MLAALRNPLIARLQTILVEVDHREPGNGESFVLIERECSAKLFHRQTKLAGSENRGA